MDCKTRSGRIVREEARKERLTRPSTPVICSLSEGPILKCGLNLHAQQPSCKGFLCERQTEKRSKLLHQGGLSYYVIG